MVLDAILGAGGLGLSLWNVLENRRELDRARTDQDDRLNYFRTLVGKSITPPASEVEKEESLRKGEFARAITEAALRGQRSYRQGFRNERDPRWDERLMGASAVAGNNARDVLRQRYAAAAGLQPPAASNFLNAATASRQQVGNLGLASLDYIRRLADPRAGNPGLNDFIREMIRTNRPQPANTRISA
jgi:hypothetical protein